MIADCPLIRFDETCQPDNGGCTKEGDYKDCSIYKAWKKHEEYMSHTGVEPEDVK